ncbi:hypothetical protein ACINKY_28675 [Paenibacillus illinoisensis]|uniref:Uncharacterized protein n=1 Tax=Paenibacillus illinoisensis TaxID=59845 RepID=A0ABW8I3F3_9BACL
MPFSIKLFAALLTVITISLYVGISRLVTLAERAEDTYYYPFWYIWIISLLINAATMLFLIFPLSLFVDRVLASMKMMGTGTRLIYVIVAYLLLGTGCGFLFAIFVFRMDAFQHSGQYSYVLMITFVYLLWQFILIWISKQRKRVS